MASETFTKEAEEKRPAVQVGDPFTEKLLLEACMELFKTDSIIGIQDMGAAGLTSSSTEMASRAGTGMFLDIDAVPARESGMNAYEALLSESQERMLIVAKRGREETVKGIFEKWGLDIAVIGRVTDDGSLLVHEKGEKVAQIPIELINDLAPAYNRPLSTPQYLNELTTVEVSKLAVPDDLGSCLKTLLSSPNISSKRWIFEQYDHMVRTNSIAGPGSDAAVIRLKGTDKAVAMTTNCNSRYCYLDPYHGAAIAVAESARNLACSGALPLAITDCLNFGNPERPEIMWQFSKAVDGISLAANAFNTPIISGNVSFYNETEETAIYPTPTIGMAGLIEDYRSTLTQWVKHSGDLIVLLGETFEEFGGSEYLSIFHDSLGGSPPRLDLAAETGLVKTLLEATMDGLLNSAHDLSEGGLAVTLAECCFASLNIFGIEVDLNGLKIREDALLFSESQSRAVVSLHRDKLDSLIKIAEKHNTPLNLIGEVGGDMFSIKGLINTPAIELYDSWSSGFERLLFSHV